MFGFGKKRAGPRACDGNPGIGAEARVAFSDGNRSWTERGDVLRLMERALRELGHETVREKGWLEHRESGFTILPQFVAVEPLEGGGVRSVTTVQVNHPTLVPEGAFEYQHSAGGNVEEAIAQGFSQWVQTDWVTLADALRPMPQDCMLWEMTLPAADARSETVRRAIMGPVAHLQENPWPGEAGGEGEEHGFCPCCLITKSFETFKTLLEGDRFYGIRLFALRDNDGETQADCRVNGEDWEPGAAALREYAKTWPGAGFEFRKQYVVMYTGQKSLN